MFYDFMVKLSKMEEKTVFINGLKINLKILGQGDPVLILHGWGDSFNSWVRVQEILAEKEFKVFIPDLPGFGKSDTPKSAWGLGDYSDFIFNLSQELNLSRFFLVGHSFGGRIAIKFTNAYPEKVKLLILCDSAGIKPKPSPQTRLFYLIAKIGNALFSKKPLTRFKNGARNSFYIFLRNRDYVKANKIMRESMKKIIEENLLPEISQIRTKTLLIWGEKDKMVPLKYAYAFKENLPNSKLEILPKIGHSPHLEAPEKLSQIILNFFKT